jgi:hypothetical protein
VADVPIAIIADAAFTAVALDSLTELIPELAEARVGPGLAALGACGESGVVVGRTPFASKEV